MNQNKSEFVEIIRGFGQTKLSRKLGIPLRTVQDWALRASSPPDWAKKLILEAISEK